MQPFSRLYTASVCSAIIPASMFSSPKSLTITASRRPSQRSSRLRNSVVLPAPRKPATTVTGMLAAFMR